MERKIKLWDKLLLSLYQRSRDKPIRLLYVYDIFVMLSHGGSVIPNFPPIMGHMIKIENFLSDEVEIFKLVENLEKPL